MAKKKKKSLFAKSSFVENFPSSMGLSHKNFAKDLGSKINMFFKDFILQYLI